MVECGDHNRSGLLPEHIQDLRGVVRSIMYKGQCFETFPKKAMMQSFSLSAFFPRSTAFVGMGKLIEWLFFCNKGLAVEEVP